MSGRADPQANTIAAALDGPRATSPEEAPPLLANRYELLGLLGAGAMGTVYRARDRELDEIVALKVLKSEIASADMTERFRREVKLARRVTHRNVARTFDIGEHGGDRFLTMEFIEGEMLATRIARKRRLGVGESVRLALDVCAGLAAAHAANVLHRDLKPENVIVARDERAVITDFGIARAATREELSRTGAGMVGTPAYMAPEQVEGRADLDGRADLYALGAMLYEMLTGAPAWDGDTIVTIAAGRLLKPPPDPRAHLPNLAAPIAEVVLKLMARQRDDRFASAEETARALEAARDAEGIPAAPSSPSLSAAPRPAPSGTLPLARALAPPRPGARGVAVLPVLNLGASDDAYLVENVTEDVVDLLSVVPNLLVRPRGDTARFRDPARDVREIGRALGVDVVVDGSLRRVGELLRASFRLITVEDGFQLWARRFERPPAELLSIADDAAHAIASALTSQLATHTRTRAGDPEAEELFLRGRHLVRRGWHESVREALDLLARANERAPDNPRVLGTYALALARVFGMEFFGREVADRARALAGRALELEPIQPEARVALAMIHLQNGEADAAIGHLRAALGVAPNSVDALDWLARLMAEVGLVDEGLTLLRRVVAIDPDAVPARQQIGRILAMTGDHAGMIAALGPMPTHPGDLPPWLLIQARDCVWRKDVAGANRLGALVAGAPVPDSARYSVNKMLAIARGEATDLRDQALIDQVLPVDGSRTPRRASFNAQIRAELYARIGEYAKVQTAVEAADANGLLDVVWLERCPLFDPLRADPAFAAVHRRIALRAARIANALTTTSSSF